MVKLCHEEMLILRCILPQKTEPPPEKNQNLSIPPNKLNCNTTEKIPTPPEKTSDTSENISIPPETI